MELVLTGLRYRGFTFTEWAITGALGVTVTVTAFGGVSTLWEVLLWGVGGAPLGVLVGVGISLRSARRLRRARDQARELLGKSATDAECVLAVRAAVRGPIPGAPKIRQAAVQLATGLLEHEPRRKVFHLVAGGAMIVVAVALAASGDVSYWYASGLGWSWLLPQLPSWRGHRRVDRLRGKAGVLC